jgi:hypothetical protein
MSSSHPGNDGSNSNAALVEGDAGYEGKEGKEDNIDGRDKTRAITRKLTTSSPHAGPQSIFSTASDDLLRLIVTYCDVSVLRALAAAASDREEASVSAAAHQLSDVPVDEVTWLRYHACDPDPPDPNFHNAQSSPSPLSLRSREGFLLIMSLSHILLNTTY